jgi:hypothetical protein
MEKPAGGGLGVGGTPVKTPQRRQRIPNLMKLSSLEICLLRSL